MSGPPAGEGPPTIKILIAEDHVVLAEALGTMLGFDDAFEVVGTVSSGSSTIFNRVEGAFPYWVTKYVNALIAVDAYSAPRLW